MDWKAIETAPEATEVLVYDRGSMYVAARYNGMWTAAGDVIVRPSAWMALPPPP